MQPGDRIVLYTDVITEARASDDTEFGLERFTDSLIRHHADGLPVPETLRRLIKAVLDYHDGHLQDDATVLICEWVSPAVDNTEPAAALTALLFSDPPLTSVSTTRPATGRAYRRGRAGLKGPVNQVPWSLPTPPKPSLGLRRGLTSTDQRRVDRNGSPRALFE
ncbi:SpoIIE family protein phosphatase [Streptomyces anulatus]|uniref:SpoIIE family protein phosphatase n=1 Tax=Streptomyces anulatus TaxID=1892 RepID=UPI003D9DE121